MMIGTGFERPHLLAELYTGLVGQHDVEQHQVGMDPVEETQAPRARRRRIRRRSPPGPGPRPGPVGRTPRRRRPGRAAGCRALARSASAGRWSPSWWPWARIHQAASSGEAAKVCGSRARGAGDDGGRGGVPSGVACARRKATTCVILVFRPLPLPSRAGGAGQSGTTSARTPRSWWRRLRARGTGGRARKQGVSW